MTKHRARPYRITVVCTGNICRSPMGEFILRERFERAGLADRVVVDSAGTQSWEVGNPADPRTLAVLERNGHEDLGGREHVARKFQRSWFDEVDLVLAADAGHFRELTRLARGERQRGKIRMFRSFDPQAERSGSLDMDDPWYGDDASFDQTYAEVVAAADGVVAHVRRELAESWSAPPGEVRASPAEQQESPPGFSEMTSASSAPFALRHSLAVGLFERGDYLAASRALAELVEEAQGADVGHGITDLRLLLARAYYHSAQLRRAEQTLRTVLEEAPTDGYAHLLLGRTLQRAGRHDEAKRSLALAEVLGGYARPAAHADDGSDGSGEGR